MRGRPKGSQNKSAQFKNYKPKKWEPLFDLIVIESCVNNISNVELSKKFGYSPQHISNILSSPQAQEVKARIRNSLDKEIQKNISETLDNIGSKAVEKMNEFINNEEYFVKSPFLFVDRAMKMAQLTNKVKNIDSPSVTNTQINIGNDVLDRISAGLNKSNNVLEKNNIKLIKDG